MSTASLVTSARTIHWFNVYWLLVIHLGAIAALFFFNWLGLFVALLFHFLTGGLGVCLGFHRLLTHQSFETHRWLTLLLAWAGTQSGQGSIVEWVAEHRKHHQESDGPHDPHSPVKSFLWGHMLWLFFTRSKEEKLSEWYKYAPRLLRDRAILRIERYWSWVGHLGLTILFSVLGYWVNGLQGAVSLFLWGMPMRMTMIFHSTWLVNSVGHRHGYRTFNTSDHSYNNLIVALFSYGEGWHNNHHAFPRSARHGHRWWEVDLTYYVILLMKWFGLAWNIQAPKLHAK